MTTVHSWRRYAVGMENTLIRQVLLATIMGLAVGIARVFFSEPDLVHRLEAIEAVLNLR